MRTLRKPPYPITISYVVPTASSAYYLVIENPGDQTETEVYLTSTSTSKVTYDLDDDFVRYDRSYAITIYESHITSDGHERGDIVVEDNLDVSRPYLDPASLGTTATEITEYTGYEALARAIIDSLTGGFYYRKTWIEVTGQGTDYLPLWVKAYRILKVYESSELVYNSLATPHSLGSWEYLITKDKSAIIKDPVTATTSFDRSERKPATIPFAASDSIGFFDTGDSGNFQSLTSGVTFGQGTDYILLLETGHKVVPYDIQDATKMLIDDIKCGKLDYYKRYIKNYQTDQFKIEYDPRMIQGTGNIIVDKILSKYISPITRPGIL